MGVVGGVSSQPQRDVQRMIFENDIEFYPVFWRYVIRQTMLRQPFHHKIAL